MITPFASFPPQDLCDQSHGKTPAEFPNLPKDTFISSLTFLLFWSLGKLINGGNKFEEMKAPGTVVEKRLMIHL